MSEIRHLEDSSFDDDKEEMRGNEVVRDELERYLRHISASHS